jgi:hypothetical protein
MAAGYARDDKAGYIVRTWVHVDPKDVTIVEKEDGGAQINLETLCLTSDVNARIQDVRYSKYSFEMKPETKAENLAWIQKHGIRFVLLLPVKLPGSYTVRFAVHNPESGKVGSTYQYVDIPDLGKKWLALSDIFMITRDVDIAWINADVAKELSEGIFFPVIPNDETPSPAFRTFSAGDKLQTLALLYDADAKEIARSEIEIQSFLYKNGKEFLSGEPRKVTPDKVENTSSIPILQKLALGSDLPPDDYLLQLLATDKKNSAKRDKDGVASKGEGIFSKLARAYLGTAKDFTIKEEKGISSRTLGFRIVDDSQDKFVGAQ